MTFCINHLSKNVWNVKLEILKALSKSAQPLKDPELLLPSDVATLLLNSLLDNINDLKYAAIRAQALEALASKNPLKIDLHIF